MEVGSKPLYRLAKVLIGETLLSTVKSMCRVKGGSEFTKLLLKMTVTITETSVFHGDFEYKKTAFQFSDILRSESKSN
jgi:hypothetical protein